MEYEIQWQGQGQARVAAWRVPAWRLSVVGAVLLAHFLALNWMHTHLHRPTTASKVSLPGLSGYILVPALPSQADRPLTATPVEAPARRPPVNPAPAAAKSRHATAPEPGSAQINAETSPIQTGQTGATDEAAVSAAPQSGGGGRENRLGLALPAQLDPSHSAARQIQQQLGSSRSLPANEAGSTATGNATSITRQQRNDGSAQERVTTPWNSYCVRSVGRTAMSPFFMSDRLVDRTALPSGCP